MITGTKEYLTPITQSHHCPEHPDKALVVAWHKDEGYVIRCGAGHYPEEVTRELTPTQEYKQGTREAHAPGLDLMVKEDLGTGKALSAYDLVELHRYADRYGLDAYRGHVMMMYGKPYIGIDGYLFHAKMEGIPYSLNSRPMTTEETKLYKIDALDHCWIAYVNRLDTGAEFMGVGIVTYDEMTAKSDRKPDQLRSPVVAAHPWQLAQKRAEWQALRRAFPIGEPTELQEVKNE